MYEEFASDNTENYYGGQDIADAVVYLQFVGGVFAANTKESDEEGNQNHNERIEFTHPRNHYGGKALTFRNVGRNGVFVA